jgi:hypothetical protein
MGLFEQHPWVLIPIVILIAEGWSATKTIMARVLQKGKSRLKARRYGE